MISKLYQIIIGAVLLIAILGGVFYSGGVYYKHRHHIAAPISDTSFIYDTIHHVINDTSIFYDTIDSINIVYDSISVPINLDTTSIIKDYFSKKTVEKEYVDSTLNIKIKEVLFKNSILSRKIGYTLLKPQTVVNTLVDNSIYNYNYIGAFINVPTDRIEYSSVGLYYNGKKIHIGVSMGFKPDVGQRPITVSLGYNMFKWKKLNK